MQVDIDGLETDRETILTAVGLRMIGTLDHPHATCCETSISAHPVDATRFQCVGDGDSTHAVSATMGTLNFEDTSNLNGTDEAILTQPILELFESQVTPMTQQPSGGIFSDNLLQLSWNHSVVGIVGTDHDFVPWSPLFVPPLPRLVFLPIRWNCTAAKVAFKHCFRDLK